MNEKEKLFHQAMIDTYHIAKRECNYTPTYFLRMLTDYGAVEAAKRLLATDKPSDGFGTLYMCNRLDLTVEAYVIKPDFASLFTPEQVETARKRLKEYGFKFD